MNKKNRGSSLDDFMKEEGLFEEAQAQAIAEAIEGTSRQVTGPLVGKRAKPRREVQTGTIHTTILSLETTSV